MAWECVQVTRIWVQHRLEYESWVDVEQKVEQEKKHRKLLACRVWPAMLDCRGEVLGPICKTTNAISSSTILALMVNWSSESELQTLLVSRYGPLNVSECPIPSAMSRHVLAYSQRF